MGMRYPRAAFVIGLCYPRAAVGDYWFLNFEYWLLAIDCWLLIADPLLIMDYWSLIVTYHFCLSDNRLSIMFTYCFCLLNIILISDYLFWLVIMDYCLLIAFLIISWLLGIDYCLLTSDNSFFHVVCRLSMRDYWLLIVAFWLLIWVLIIAYW